MGCLCGRGSESWGSNNCKGVGHFVLSLVELGANVESKISQGRAQVGRTAECVRVPCVGVRVC